MEEDDPMELDLAEPKNLSQNSLKKTFSCDPYSNENTVKASYI